MLKDTLPSNIEWLLTFKNLVVKLHPIIALLSILILFVFNNLRIDKLLVNLYKESVKSPPFICVAFREPKPIPRIYISSRCL